MSEPLQLRYRKPATCWEETLPLGNGHIGAMVWGGVNRERIGLNEITLWSGYEHEHRQPEALAALPEVRKLIDNGEYEKAQQVLEKRMLGDYSESYLPLGDLLLDFSGEGEASEYVRELSFTDACARTRYRQNGVSFTRTAFVCHPHRALVFHLASDAPALNVAVCFESQLHCTVRAEGSALYIDGQCPEHCDPDYTHAQNPPVWGTRGIRFTAALRVLETDGQVKAENGSLQLHNATFAVFAFTAVENPNLADVYTQLCYEGLYKAHCADYQALFERVSLDLGPQPDLPTDERLALLRDGADDPALFALYFQYGRYLMISASRDAELPMNLQGLWNWEIQPPWSCNYTTNINLQMNYWPALSCALPECLAPYFTFLKRLCENGQETAKALFGCRGFTVSHNTDRWAITHPVGVIYGQTEGAPGSAHYVFFPLGGAWLCQEVWRYYEYTADREFLSSTAYPLLRQAALFCVDWLTERGGYLVTCPSASPENAFRTADGQEASIGCASTMDMTIIREVFQHFQTACEALGLEDPLLIEIEQKQGRLFPYQTGRFGQLQEWNEDFDEPEPGHRHLSHLYGLFPSELFEGDDALKTACRRSIDRRLENGGGHTGWSCAWLISLFAVLGDGEGAYAMLRTLLTRSTAPNLWDLCPPYQIDGNFGGTAGIANLLVQDRGGELRFLPALPKAFPNGSVHGLRVKGNRAVDIVWRDGKLVEKRVYSC